MALGARLSLEGSPSTASGHKRERTMAAGYGGGAWGCGYGAYDGEGWGLKGRDFGAGHQWKRGAGRPQVKGRRWVGGSQT